MKSPASSQGNAGAPPEQDGAPRDVAPVTERSRFIEQSAIAVGQTWARQWRHDLHREGRPAAGGWPGTLREARTQVAHALLVAMVGRRMPAITGDERERAARTAYASAREEWRRHLEPEIP